MLGERLSETNALIPARSRMCVWCQILVFFVVVRLALTIANPLLRAIVRQDFSDFDDERLVESDFSKTPAKIAIFGPLSVEYILLPLLAVRSRHSSVSFIEVLIRSCVGVGDTMAMTQLA